MTSLHCTTIPSTLLVIVVLLSTFIYFDSYRWRLSSFNWSISSFFQPVSVPVQGGIFVNFDTTTDNLTLPPKSIQEDARKSVDERGTASNVQHGENNVNIEVKSEFTEKIDEEVNGRPQHTNEKELEPIKDPEEMHSTPADRPGTYKDQAAVKSVANSEDHAAEGAKQKQENDWKISTDDLEVLRNTSDDFQKVSEAKLSEGAGNSTVLTEENGDRAPRLSPAFVNTSRLSPPSAPMTAKDKEVIALSNLQKLELDLWQARAAIRRVVVTQLNGTESGGKNAQDAHQDSLGDVFRNTAIFRQSYDEMEKRLKIYVYEEGEEPLVHNGPCKEIYAIEGRFIQELQGGNPFVTSDPEEAHVFFLPFSVAMMVTYLYTVHSMDMSPLQRFVRDYVTVIGRKYPYWNRSGGGDHFMLSCHDWGPHISRADENLATNAIRVLCNANISEGYLPTKDASLPEINLVGGQVPTQLGGRPASERNVLAFFAGADHGPVRPDLFKHWEGKDGEVLVYHTVPAGTSYHDYMKISKYCLCPGGYEVNSPRIVEAIYNDCVPVIIADKFVLPFSDVLNWKLFSLQILEKDIPDLKKILEAIPMDRYRQMQSKVKQVQQHFVLNQPPKRYDVFHMILHSVWLRRLNIRLQLGT